MTLDELKHLHRDLIGARELVASESQAFREAIREARKSHTVNQIADALGVHRQRVYQLLKEGGES